MGGYREVSSRALDGRSVSSALTAHWAVIHFLAKFAPMLSKHKKRDIRLDVPFLWQMLIIMIRFHMVSLNNETLAYELKPCR